uniref:UPI0001A86C63 related cluster n=1 Tax=Saccharum spontaneum TaxID=62335 RepID=A0A678T500_SACSP|nr:UPI0001A86C63 related cluster [Saccharum spontaneum]
MGTNVDRSMNDGHGPLVFKICDQIHHRIGSLLPPDGRPPKFIQLYIYDTANEISTVQTTLSTNIFLLPNNLGLQEIGCKILVMRNSQFELWEPRKGIQFSIAYQQLINFYAYFGRFLFRHIFKYILLSVFTKNLRNLIFNYNNT